MAPVSAIVSGPTLLASAEFGPCPADAYCPTQDTVVACPPNTTAPAGSAREEQCWCLAGFAGAARFSLTLFLRACFSTSKHGGLVSVSVLGPGEVPPQTTGWTLCPSAAPETLFQSHLPDRCVTVRPPYALHTLLVNLGPQSASLISCFLLLDRQARAVPVCAASRPRISWQLPLWGQDPTWREREREKFIDNQIDD